MPAIAEILSSCGEFAAIRRDLHQHPETAFKEERTSRVIAKLLTDWGIPVHTGLGGTGVVGILKAGSGTGCIALRSDMDALPMSEENHFAHASANPGAMHACGHDGHMATLLCAAKYLAATRRFDGTVLFVFQPAEEEGRGARAMIDGGFFDLWQPSEMYGLHNWPGLPEGVIASRPGALMAACNTLFVNIRGCGTHGAAPHLGTDPVFAAVQTASALQSIITRFRNPIEPAVLSICKIAAGTTHNVVPDTAEIQGTVRTFSEAMTDMICERATRIAQMTTQALECTATVRFRRDTLPVINDRACLAAAMAAARSVTEVDDAVDPSMVAEDFCYWGVRVPSCFVFLGEGDGSHRPQGCGDGPCKLHGTSFDFNDRLIAIGASWFARLAETRLPLAH